MIRFSFISESTKRRTGSRLDFYLKPELDLMRLRISSWLGRYIKERLKLFFFTPVYFGTEQFKKALLQKIQKKFSFSLINAKLKVNENITQNKS